MAQLFRSSARDPKEDSQTHALERGLAILAHLSMNGGTLGVSEIARSLEMSKSTVFRLLRTLAAAGYVINDPLTGRYSLTFKLLYLADQHVKGMNLHERSMPHLRHLRDLSGETIALYVAVGLERACVELLESPQQVLRTVPIGRTMPLTSGTTGRVMLAFREDSEIDQILRECPPPSFTPHSIVDVTRFLASLKQVRSDGYCLAVDETYLGVGGVAAPIRNHTGKVVAALSVSGPSNRLTVEHMTALAPTVVQVANRISADLGAR